MTTLSPTRRLVLASTAGLLAVGLLASCAGTTPDDTSATGGTAGQPTGSDPTGADQVTVTDSAGREITVDLPVERVAILDDGTATVMRGLGVLDTLVGSHEGLVGNPLWADIQDVPAVASYSETSYEKLAEVQPQVVLSSVRAHGVVTDNDLLKGLDITDIKVSLRRPDIIKDEITMLGQVFQAPDKAQEIVDFYDEVEQEIADRISDVPEDDRPTVFVEYHAGDFNTGGPHTRFYEQVPLAGGRNIAADLDDEQQVSAEWVAERNPDVIVREGAALGWGVEDTAAADQMRAEVMSRPGLSETDAVKNGRVYVLPIAAYSRPGYVIGIAHIAQWLYPDRFDDAFVAQVEKEYMEHFFPGVEPSGIWAYPTPSHPAAS